MDDKKRLKVKLWSYAGLWIGIIYATLYIVRPIQKFLRAHTPFSLMVHLVLGLSLLALTVLFVRVVKKAETRRIASYIHFGACLLVYIIGFAVIKLPEEKIHFIEYGVLGFLVYRAIALDVKGWKAFLFAFIISGALGWIDEIIQYYLPNRYYDNRDIVFNCLGAFLGLNVLYVLLKTEEKENEFLRINPQKKKLP